MQDNSPSQHVQEACPSRCTLPYSQRPAILLPLSPSVSLSPLRPPKRSVSPLRGEAETGEEQMGELCGSKEGFARLRFEERRLAVRRVRGDFRCVEKTGHLSSRQRSQSGGRISGLETIVIIKVSSFTLCASLRLCFSLFFPPQHLCLPDLPQRIMGRRAGRDWCKERSVSLFAHQHILADSHWSVRQQVI